MARSPNHTRNGSPASVSSGCLRTLKANSFVRRLYTSARALLTTLSPTLNTLVTFRISKGKWPNLRHPQTFNEKVSWLKLRVYNHSDVVRQCADKVAVRDYVSASGLSCILVPLLGVYNDPDSIPWNSLPERFVLKSSTGSGGNVICTSRASLDVRAARRSLWRAFRSTAYKQNAELHYRGTQPRVLCEVALLSDDNRPPTDYKFYCSFGRVIAFLAVLDRFGKLQQKRYLNVDDPNFSNAAHELGIGAEEILRMLRICAVLSAPFPHVRVDLYLVKGNIYFSELTFTPAGGIHSGISERFDKIVGTQIQLPSDGGAELRVQPYESLLQQAAGTGGSTAAPILPFVRDTTRPRIHQSPLD